MTRQPAGKRYLVWVVGVLGVSGCSDEISGAAKESVARGVIYESPRALIGEMNRLQSGECPFQCQLTIAGMYSQGFLQAQRDAVMSGIRDAKTRRETSLAFFGKEIPIEALQGMTQEEFLAHQWAYAEEQAPSGWKMRTIEIVSEDRVSADHIQAVVVRGGAEIDPNYQEEILMNFVREDGGWRIRN